LFRFSFSRFSSAETSPSTSSIIRSSFHPFVVRVKLNDPDRKALSHRRGSQAPPTSGRSFVANHDTRLNLQTGKRPCGKSGPQTQEGCRTPPSPDHRTCEKPAHRTEACSRVRAPYKCPFGSGSLAATFGWSSGSLSRSRYQALSAGKVAIYCSTVTASEALGSASASMWNRFNQLSGSVKRDLNIRQCFPM
jgi:hypothetical protein